MELVKNTTYTFFTKLSLFSELTPITKIKFLILFFIVIALPILFYVIFSYKQDKKVKKNIKIISSLLFVISLFSVMLYFPNSTYSVLYPRYSENQKIYKLGTNTFLESSDGTLYLLKDGIIQQQDTFKVGD